MFEHFHFFFFGHILSLTSPTDTSRSKFFMCVRRREVQMIIFCILIFNVVLHKTDVKIVKFGDIVEARTVQWSSLLCLIHPYASLISKGIFLFSRHTSLLASDDLHR